MEFLKNALSHLRRVTNARNMDDMNIETSENKETACCLVKPNKSGRRAEESKVNGVKDDTIHMDVSVDENIVTYENKTESHNCHVKQNVSNDYTVQVTKCPNGSSSKDTEPEQTGPCKFKYYEINNSNTTDLTQKDTLSCIQEFNMILREYEKEAYNELIEPVDIKVPSFITTLQETEEILNSLCENPSKENLADPNTSATLIKDKETMKTEEDILKENDGTMTYWDDSTQLTSGVNKINYDNTNIDDIIHITRAKETLNSTKEITNVTEPLKIDIELPDCNETIYNYSYEFTDDDVIYGVVQKDNALNKDNDVISINSVDTNDLMLLGDKDPSNINLELNEENMLAEEANFIDNKNVLDESDSEGYNSSDFEFIDENEAHLSGLVNLKDLTKFKNSAGARKALYAPGSSKMTDEIISISSGLEDESYENNHVIPEGDDYIELFDQPWLAYNFQAENKSFISTKAMHFNADNLGFDACRLNRLQAENEVDDAAKQEAAENAKKIRSMYPVDNRKRPRRY